MKKLALAFLLFPLPLIILLVFVDQKRYEAGLSAEELARYQSLVLAMYNSAPGDLAITETAVYEVIGRKGGNVLFRKSVVSEPVEMTPELVCRKRVKKIVGKDSPDHPWLYMKFANQL